MCYVTRSSPSALLVLGHPSVPAVHSKTISCADCQGDLLTNNVGCASVLEGPQIIWVHSRYPIQSRIQGPFYALKHSVVSEAHYMCRVTRPSPGSAAPPMFRAPSSLTASLHVLEKPSKETRHPALLDGPLSPGRVSVFEASESLQGPKASSRL